MRPTGSRAIKPYMPLWAKEKEAGVWDFKREDSLRQDGKSKCLLNKCLPCLSETMEHREEFEQTGPVRLPSAHPN